LVSQQPSIRMMCATCVHRKTSVNVSERLLGLCYQLVLDKRDEVAIIGIVEEAVALSKVKHKCAREPHVWIHLLDKACALWELRPREYTS
jgi:hypothetical protein